MPKRIMWLVLTLCIITGVSWAIDLNHSTAFAGAINTENGLPPSQIEGSLKKLAANSPVYLDDDTLIYNVDDGKWWTFPNNAGKKWTYMIVKFIKPESYPEWGQLRWRAGRAAQTKHITCWRWNGASWIKVVPQGEYSGTAVDMPTYYYANIEDTYFVGSQSLLWIMIQVETTTGNRWLRCDVCDIQYEY